MSQNNKIFIQENAFRNVVYKMAAILSWPQCVNTWSAMRGKTVALTSPVYGKINMFKTSATRLCDVSMAILMMTFGPVKLNKIIDSQWIFEGNIYNFRVISVPADGLALLGAKISAGTVMTKLRFLIYVRADFRFVPSQWEMVLLCNHISQWLGTSLESVLYVED